MSNHIAIRELNPTASNTVIWKLSQDSFEQRSAGINCSQGNVIDLRTMGRKMLLGGRSVLW